jgi:hypothetical protein
VIYCFHIFTPAIDLRAFSVTSKISIACKS